MIINKRIKISKMNDYVFEDVHFISMYIYLDGSRTATHVTFNCNSKNVLIHEWWRYSKQDIDFITSSLKRELAKGSK